MMKSVLYFGRKNCVYSNELRNFIRKRTRKFYYIESDLGKKLSVNKIKKFKFDYIFCFRSFHILKKDLINRCNIAPINFHPGPPEYRGIGCINYALYNNSKFYGSTCHTIINEKVDNGKILDVKKFKLTNKDTIDSALKKTYKIMLIQAKSIINLLFKDPNNLKKLIENNKNIYKSV